MNKTTQHETERDRLQRLVEGDEAVAWLDHTYNNRHAGLHNKQAVYELLRRLVVDALAGKEGVMDAKTNGALPARPWDERNDDGTFYNGSPGMTKREMFAMAAMQGVLSNASREFNPDGLAQYAAECADALLAELSKEKP